MLDVAAGKLVTEYIFLEFYLHFVSEIGSKTDSFIIQLQLIIMVEISRSH